MVRGTALQQESLERAQRQDLEGVIRRLSTSNEPRVASRRQAEQRRLTLVKQLCDPGAAALRLERIMQGNEMTDIGYLAQGMLTARSICRIVIRDRGERVVGYGTGFLVAPGVVLTNHHVLTTIDDVRYSLAQFQFERDLNGKEVEPVTFKLKVDPEPILFKDLDMALAAVESVSTNGSPLSQFGHLPLNPEPGKAFVGEYLTIIQHPNGERKQICVRENKLLKYSENGPYIWYETDTVAGSSGSPVFNNSWQVVALHHSSVPRTKKVKGQDVWLAKDGQRWKPEMGDDQIDWMANEGIRVSRIVHFLRSQHGSHPLALAVASAPEPDECAVRLGAVEDGDRIRVMSGHDGRTRVLVPIEIGVHVGLQGLNGNGTVSHRQNGRLASPDLAMDVRSVEAVRVDQTNYSKRNGFQPEFLGGGLVVPLPKLTGEASKEALAIKGKNPVLHYWNYSVVMSRKRRLAMYSAANIDPDHWKGNRDADGDTWFRDTRVDKIDKSAQLGQEFYGKQKTFEADRTKNPFDRGHLTRRRDLQWGATDEEAKRNGDDSFHFTNCSPQHWQFNQDNRASGLWFRLEESAATTLSNGGRLCVFNGPVFDAPRCVPTADGRLRLNLKGKRVADGTFGDIRVPRQFFKVIAYNDDGRLVARAFVVTQEDLLDSVDRFVPAEAKKRASVLTDAEIRLYRASLRDLGRVTGLDFGALVNAEEKATSDEAARLESLPIERVEELFV